MARLDGPAGEGGDAVQIWPRQPDLGAATTRFVHAVYNKNILPTRVREAARMRIAQLNECTVCLGFKADTVKAQGLDEGFYCAIGMPDEGVLSDQERLAVEYVERFAIDHTSIDDEFVQRLQGSFTDPEIFYLTVCMLALLGLGRTLRAPRPAAAHRVPLEQSVPAASVERIRSVPMMVRLVIDPVACDAYGYGAELLPEFISLDEWGYPIVDGKPLPADLVGAARRAARDCPRRAITLRMRMTDR